MRIETAWRWHKAHPTVSKDESGVNPASTSDFRTGRDRAGHINGTLTGVTIVECGTFRKGLTFNPLRPFVWCG
jgi:hypothetical protein